MLLIAVTVWVAYYARTALGPLQESMRLALHLSDNQIALLQGPAQAIPVVLAAVPLALLIDRQPRVRWLFVFAALDLLGTLLTALASTFAVLFLARCLVGLTAIATLTTAFSLVADLYPPHQRGRSSMILAVCQMAGNSVAFALGGTLLAQQGARPDGWRSALFWPSGLLALTMLSMLLMREPARTGVTRENPSARGAWSQLWRYRQLIVPLLSGKVMIEIAFGAVYIWAAPTLLRAFALSPGHVGSIMATGLIISGLLGPLVGGTLADVCQRTVGPVRTVSVLSLLALLSTPAALFAVATTATSASVLLVIFLVIVNAVIVIESALFTVVIPNEIRGLSVALSFAAGTLAALGLAPLAVSLLSEPLGGPASIGKALAWIAATSSVLAALIFALAWRCFHRSVLLEAR